jgi:hypothetical protein
MGCIKEVYQFSRSYKRHLHGASWGSQWWRKGERKGREERRDTGDTLSFCLRKKLRV